VLIAAASYQGNGGPAIPTRVPAVFPASWRFPAGTHGTFAQHGIVASDNVLAAQAGVEVMQEGGNAVDAAVATGFALAVAYPEAGNLGGGGYMVIRMADGRTAAIDYREAAPLAATRDMYVGPDGKLTGESVIGPKASGVPGSVAGMVEAHRKFGKLPLARVLAPALRLASEGFVVDSAMYRSLRGENSRIGISSGKTLFLPGGSPPAIGSRLVQAQLAHTIKLIADSGARAFYRGSIADSIAAEMKQIGGLITKEDLARYQPVWRTPIRSSFRGYSFIAMPPSSSGGTTVTEILNILEAYGPPSRFGSAAEVHAVASASQRAFVDRNSKLGDPGFAKVPLATLTSKTYARSLARAISRDHADPTSSLGGTLREGSETTHYSVVDQFGNAVATTTTLNDLYGSGIYISGAGIFMNDEMDDFTSKVGVPNMFGLIQGEANAIAPGKRMLSAMSPTIVLDKNGKVLLVVGAAGGPTIITATTQIILNVIDGAMSLSDAMKAPRMHEQAWPDGVAYERGGLSQAVVDSLTAMGYRMHVVGGLANANAVMRVGDAWQGMSEPRSSGAAVGY